MGGIPPAEGDLAVGEGNQPLVGDRDAVGVTAEVAQRLLGTAEGRLQVDDFLRNSVRKKAEKARSWERNRRLTVKAESSGREGLPAKPRQTCRETLQARMFLGKEEVVVTRRDPAALIGREAAGRDDAVRMGVVPPAPTTP